MHLAGETDASDVFAGEIRARKRFANCDARGAPPIFRLLLRPSNLRGRERLMIRRGGGNEPPAFVDDGGACAARADVNAEYVDKASSTAQTNFVEDIIYSQPKMTREGSVRAFSP